ncbi:MAG: glycosyltransferase family 4 protein [Actinobacteria bacterium]|nr:glycosyltransferase family 4 protein [Actinomycetota bacterium]
MTVVPPQPKHLLTVLHAAERTGPALMALHFLRWLREHHPEWATSTLLIDCGGGLEPEFAELGPLVVAGPAYPFGPGNSRVHRGVIRRKLRTVRRRVAALGPVDVTQVHCAGSMRIRPVLPDAPVVCHVHELSVGLDLHLGPMARDALQGADRFVVASESVREALAARFRIDPALVTRHHEFVAPYAATASRARVDLGLPPDAFVVVGSGVRHWRKGPELFVRTALTARRRSPDIDWRFLWVGGADSGGLESLVRSADLGDLVEFVPHQPDPQQWFAAGDAFLLTAREDAFPLVCVEAALAGDRSSPSTMAAPPSWCDIRRAVSSSAFPTSRVSPTH